MWHVPPAEIAAATAMIATANFRTSWFTSTVFSKTVKGGKRFGFAALVSSATLRAAWLWPWQGAEVPEAIRKANESARRSMMRVHLREGRTIDHDS